MRITKINIAIAVWVAVIVAILIAAARHHPDPKVCYEEPLPNGGTREYCTYEDPANPRSR